jgi:hypothetical protein
MFKVNMSKLYLALVLVTTGSATRVHPVSKLYQHSHPELKNADHRLSQVVKCLKVRSALNGKGKFVTDIDELSRHRKDIFDATKQLRPNKRSHSSIYQGYKGPRLEDHFMQWFVDEPQDTFGSVVPVRISIVTLHIALILLAFLRFSSRG